MSPPTWVFFKKNNRLSHILHRRNQNNLDVREAGLDPRGHDPLRDVGLHRPHALPLLAAPGLPGLHFLRAAPENTIPYTVETFFVRAFNETLTIKDAAPTAPSSSSTTAA